MSKKCAWMTLALLLPTLAGAAPRIEDGGASGRKIYQRSAMACLVSNDFYIVHFTAFQETPSIDRRGNSGPFAKHCQDVPSIGKTYLTADLLDRDVRGTPIALRVVEEERVQGQAPKILRTLAETPAKIYSTGVAEIHTDIDKAGTYALLLDVGEGALSEDDHLRVPFNVAMSASSGSSLSWMFPISLAAALLGFSSYYYLRWRRSRSGLEGDPNPAPNA